MLKYHGSHLVRPGIIGVVITLLIIAVGLQPSVIAQSANTIGYQALFSEAGGLVAGNDVRVAGMKVGTVSGVSLDKGKAHVRFRVNSSVALGSQTTAHIRTATLLGQRILTLESAGTAALHPDDAIPVSRTSSPYSLTEAVSDLTTNTAGTDTAGINEALDALSDTIDRITPQLGPTFDGVTRLSRSLNNRNDALRSLLESAGKASGVLAQRSSQLNALLLGADDLIGMLSERRQAIVNILASVSALSRELSGLVADNETTLAPALQKLNSVTAMLEKNRDNIGQALPGLAKYQITQGEAVANGFFYEAFVANLLPGTLAQPFYDYAFGFRRGNNAGQPPDNAGPRAELPLPYNGIPQPAPGGPR